MTVFNFHGILISPISIVRTSIKRHLWTVGGLVARRRRIDANYTNERQRRPVFIISLYRLKDTGTGSADPYIARELCQSEEEKQSRENVSIRPSGVPTARRIRLVFERCFR